MLRIIAGSCKNRQILIPKGSQTRPTSNMLREALFNICQTYIEGACFLDLYAGSGAMGIEALSRGAAHAAFVDASRESISCIKNNVQLLQLESQSEILSVPVEMALKKFLKLERKFDIIYADPPYSSKTSEIKSESAKILKFLNENILLEPGGHFFIEEGHFSLDSFAPHHLAFVRSRSFGKSHLLEFKF
ncbi:MAG TPA: 16S rRNA (guanine(966)-N(2))-methyltransferase RsmD [Waddliaceae bacterium]